MIHNKEFEGNIKVTISENEVRLWVCNLTGENIFRFKAIGKVYKYANHVTILPPIIKEPNQSEGQNA